MGSPLCRHRRRGLPLGSMPQPPLLTVRPRVDAIDALRGAVMILMALDHTRDYFSNTVFLFDPTDLTRTTVPLFFTRWVTHFCAPVFVFLAGTGAYLSLARGKTKGQLSRFLLTRGLFLVILDPTLIRHTWFWDLNWRFSFVQVIWVIGWAMVILAGLIHLRHWVVVVLAVGTIAAHNLLDGISPPGDTAWGMAWRFLHQRDLIQPFERFDLLIIYPLIPWVAVLWAGYAFGPIVQFDPRRRRRWFLTLGFSVMFVFLVLRGFNLYGDPRPWTGQNDAVFTMMSLLTCEKYPPSLMYLLMTLGPAIAALAILDRPLGAVGGWMVTFGRVPMFYYILHAPILHALSIAAMFPRLGTAILTLDFNNPPPNFGFGLLVVYAVWIGVVAALYFPCRWFAGVKRRRNDWWLGYL